MERVLGALEEQHGELESLLGGLAADGWHSPSPCDGWDVADVVTHLSQTDEMALASAEGRFAEFLDVLSSGVEGVGGVDEGADALVVKERGRPDAEVFERWRSGAAALRSALAAADPHTRVQWVVGTLSVHTLTATRLAECWIHSGDVADALGVERTPTDRLEHIARLAWRTLPYAFAKDGRELSGPVAFDLVAPSGARWEFQPDGQPATVVTGDGVELCNVAGRRLTPDQTGLVATGPDADAVLELVRTYA
jgi:uncharacterized protein (TIGR03084 family)